MQKLDPALKQALETCLAYKIKQDSLFLRAITHRSLSLQGSEGLTSYERLEFLGDRVLGLAVAALLYHHFPNEAEGALSRRLMSLVNRDQIANCVQSLGLQDFLQLSNGEEMIGGRHNNALQADLGEALIGAIWLDDQANQGQSAFDFVERNWKALLTQDLRPPKDPKTTLQEWCMAKKLPLPNYLILNQSGPDHAPLFDMSLEILGFVKLFAKERTRRACEQSLASQFLKNIKLS